MSLGLAACGDDDNGTAGTGGAAGIDGVSATTPRTIAGAIIAGDDFEILALALAETNLVTTLDDPSASFTVFAPTDDAFALLINTLDANRTTPNPYDQDGDGDFDLEDLLALPNLADILSYHVVSGEELETDEVTAGAPSNLSTTEGSLLQIDVDVTGNLTTVLLDGSSVMRLRDVQAGNGVIHVIDSVLFPPNTFPGNVMERLQIAPSFTMLVDSLAQMGLSDDLAAASGVTLFAPTNPAFLAMLELDTITSNDLLFLNLLLYHIVPQELQASAFTSGPVTTLIATEGDSAAFDPTLEVTVEGTVLRVGSPSGASDALVIGTDLVARNGVIHVIDDVLVPDRQ